MSSPLVVRSVDVGYGHIKFSDGRDANNRIQCDSFPSRSPIAHEKTIVNGGIMHSRDTFLVEVNGQRYEVGRAVALATQSNHEGENLDSEFSMSDVYTARLYGALSYMLPTVRSHVIDYLVMGLPLNTVKRLAPELAKRFSGEHIVNISGAKIEIKECHIYPQPLGAYMAYLNEHHNKKQSSRGSPMALVVDPGYNTVDWFVCKGMSANDVRSNAVMRGMSSVLRAIAEKIIASKDTDATTSELVRRLDESMSQNLPFSIYGKEVDLKPYLAAGAGVIEEAVQAIKNSVGSGADIDVILVAGGGANLYADALRKKFPHHEVTVLNTPALANVRGFQLIGELLAKSAQRVQ